MEAAIGDDHTWYEFLPVLSWIIAEAAVARQTLEQAVQQLDRSAAEANRLAAIAHWASYATVLCLLRRDIYVALDLDRDRVTDLRREEPLAAAAAAAEPGPGAALRPGCGLLINVGRGIVLLLRTEPSEHVMHSFSLRWEEDRDAWYPGWLSHVKREVTHALHRLNRARSEAERVHPDLARFLAVPTSSEPEGAATAVEACVATAERCGRAAHHAREASENLRRVLVTLRGLRDDILDDPPPRRLMQFFGPPIADADTAGAAAAGDEAAAAGD